VGGKELVFISSSSYRSITDLKVYLKSNPTSKSKLHNNALKYRIPYSPLFQKKERGRERGEKKK